MKAIADIVFFIATQEILLREENGTSWKKTTPITEILLDPSGDGESYPFDTLEVWVKPPWYATTRMITVHELLWKDAGRGNP